MGTAIASTAKKAISSVRVDRVVTFMISVRSNSLSLGTCRKQRQLFQWLVVQRQSVSEVNDDDGSAGMQFTCLYLPF